MLHDHTDVLSPPDRRTRREVLVRASAGAVGLGLRPGSRARGAAHEISDQASDAFANIALPPEMGQASRQVYVEATGQTLRGSMLDYWRANGTGALYGNPISEPFAAANGYYSQAFEHIVLQYRPEFRYTHDPIMRPLPIGEMALANQLDASRSSAERRALRDAARPLDATDARVARIVGDGGRFVEATGHTISGDLLAWYTFNEGAFYLGNPLTEPFETERETVAQYFAGGLLTAGKDGVTLAPLVEDLAPQLGIDTTPVERGDLPHYDELLFWTAENPNPLGDPYAPGPKWLEVSIAQQQLWANQGDTTISSSLVSTGLEPNGTNLGLFHVRLKFAEQDMAGFTNDTGEVLGFGEAPPGTIPYSVEAVPHVVYFNMDAEALHGAYWLNSFGQPMSHGCVNLPLEFAAWLFGWAPLGTGVWIHA